MSSIRLISRSAVRSLNSLNHGHYCWRNIQVSFNSGVVRHSSYFTPGTKHFTSNEVG
jgi:hypothetical protein